MKNKHLGKRFGALRRHLRWQQSELAKKSGVNHTAISKFEHGRRSISLDHFTTLCRTMGASADVIMELEADSERIDGFDERYVTAGGAVRTRTHETEHEH